MNSRDKENNKKSGTEDDLFNDLSELTNLGEDTVAGLIGMYGLCESTDTTQDGYDLDKEFINVYGQTEAIDKSSTFNSETSETTIQGGNFLDNEPVEIFKPTKPKPRLGFSLPPLDSVHTLGKYTQGILQKSISAKQQSKTDTVANLEGEDGLWESTETIQGGNVRDDELKIFKQAPSFDEKSTFFCSAPMHQSQCISLPISVDSLGQHKASLLQNSIFAEQQRETATKVQYVVITAKDEATARKIAQNLSSTGVGVLGTIGMFYRISRKKNVICATPYKNMQFDSENDPYVLVKLINQEYENQAQAKIITSNTDLTSEPSSKRPADEEKKPVANKKMCMEPDDLLHVKRNDDLKIKTNLNSWENFVADIYKLREHYPEMEIETKDDQSTTFTISCKKTADSGKNLNVVERMITDAALRRQIQITIDRPKTGKHQQEVASFLEGNRRLLETINKFPRWQP